MNILSRTPISIPETLSNIKSFGTNAALEEYFKKFSKLLIDKLLNVANVVGTPGSGFGPSGEGYFRFSAFADRDNVLEAMERIKNLK